MWREFKEFALKGNVIDLAVGVIIGGAFGKIVTSLVNDLIMPIFALFMSSGVNFTDMKVTIGEVTIAYGNFIQNVVDFLIIAFSIFIAIRLISKSRKKDQVNPAPAEPAKPTEQELLAEIRDLLKSQSPHSFQQPGPQMAAQPVQAQTPQQPAQPQMTQQPAQPQMAQPSQQDESAQQPPQLL
jgi:large conductance mechanosensitive channel